MKEVSGPVPQSRSKKLYDVHVMYKYMYSFLPAATAMIRHHAASSAKRQSLASATVGGLVALAAGRGRYQWGAVWSANALRDSR